MNDDEIIGFSWPALFSVTSFSCFLFSGFLWLLDGTVSKLFLSIGAGSLLLALAWWVISSHRRSRKTS
jgi:hypothetical protein